MKRLLATYLLLCGCVGALAQSIPFPGPGTAHTSYQGPGDIVSGAKFFFGVIAYNNAYAGGKALQLCTPLDASCLDVTVTGTTLNAATLATLACDNASNKCTVKTAYDQSGALSCGGAVCDVTQATIANRPTFVVAGAANGCTTTALPCFLFTFASSQFLLNATGYTQAQPYTEVGVGIRTGNVTEYQAIIGSSTGPNSFGFGGAANNVYQYGDLGGEPPLIAASDNVWHSLAGLLNDASSAFNVDGSDSSPGSPGAGSQTGSIAIGEAIGGTDFIDGKVAVAFRYNGTTTSTQRNNLSSNLHTNLGF